MTKRRLDTLLVDRGLADSRAKAQAMVMAGQVLVDDRPAPKPGVMVAEMAELHVVQGPRFVSRGGEKLDHALERWRIDVSNAVCADIGASTGGFTDCLLQRGAAKVYAIDVGKGQLDYGLRNDQRVAVMEGVNARDMVPLPEQVDIAVIDVSFISLRLVLPAVVRLLRTSEGELPLAATNGPDSRSRNRQVADRLAGGDIVALFKPQFEAAKGEVPRGGVITDPSLHATLIGRFASWCVANGLHIVDLVASPILGGEGNREFLFWLRPRAPE